VYFLLEWKFTSVEESHNMWCMCTQEYGQCEFNALITRRLVDHEKPGTILYEWFVVNSWKLKLTLIMKTILKNLPVMMLLAGALVVVSCNQSKENAELSELEEQIQAEKEQVVSDLEELREDVSDQLLKIEEEIEGAPEEVKEALNNIKDELEHERDEINESLEKVKDATEETWNDIKADAQGTFKKIKDKMAELSDRA